MDKKEKKSNYIWIIAVVVIILIVAIVLGFRMMGKSSEIGDKVLYTEENGIKKNTSKKLAEEKTMDGLKFTNIQLVYEESASILTADVVNESGEKKGDFDVDLKILDQNGEEIITIMGYIPEVEAGETTRLDTAVTLDVAGAYNFEISKTAE